jgi:hypothetical protein
MEEWMGRGMVWVGIGWGEWGLIHSFDGMVLKGMMARRND